MMNNPTMSGYGNSVYSFYMSKNRILTSIKGCNSTTNLLKMTLYNPNLDIINVNVHTKFGLILSILCQDIEQHEILTSIKGRYYVANLRKMKLSNPNIELINEHVHTKFVLILFIGSQDIERKRHSDINQGL